MGVYYFTPRATPSQITVNMSTSACRVIVISHASSIQKRPLDAATAGFPGPVAFY